MIKWYFVLNKDISHEILVKLLYSRDVRFETKVGHIGPKWDKSKTFLDQISVHFGSPSQNELKSDLKKSQICLIWGYSDQLVSEISHGCDVDSIGID